MGHVTGHRDPFHGFAAQYDWLATEQMVSGDLLWDRFGDHLDSLPSGARVLDCACGTGYDALALVQHGFTVTASDVSEAMLLEARRKLETKRPSIAAHGRTCRTSSRSPSMESCAPATR